MSLSCLARCSKEIKRNFRADIKLVKEVRVNFGAVAASVAFLIARCFSHKRILKLVEGNKKFLAIDKAIGENGFNVVTLLLLSSKPPFSLGIYLYGLTYIKFLPYVLGNCLGMLPGKWAYVSAGAFGRTIII